MNECNFCGADMQPGDGGRAMGLICEDCIDNMEWDDNDDSSPMAREESWSAPQDPGHKRSARWK